MHHTSSASQISKILPISPRFPDALLGGSATASITGSWLPQAGGGTAPGEPGVAQDANYGLTIDLGQLAGGQDAFGAGRNFVFDVTSGAEAVAGGNFASNQTLTYLSGDFDGNAPPVPALMFPGDVTSLPLTGVALANASASSSTYVVVGSTATLTIPIQIVLEVEDLELTYAGQLVATARVPEPSSLGLIVAMLAGSCGMAIVARRRR